MKRKRLSPEDSLAGISGVYVEAEIPAPLAALGVNANGLRSVFAEALDREGITVLSVEEWHRDINAIALRIDVANVVRVGGEGLDDWQSAIVSMEIGAYQAARLVRDPDILLPAWTWFKRALFTFRRSENPNTVLEENARDMAARFIAAYRQGNSESAP